MALKEKILVTVDGSERSLETVGHVAQRKPFQKKHLVLFNVFISLPDFYWDIEKVSFMPVFIKGNKPPGNSMLIAMDPSECSMQAVDFAGELMSGFDFKATLFHAIRGPEVLTSRAGNMSLPKEDIHTQKDDMRAVFDQAKRRLINFGFKSENIISKIITGVSSRTRAIVQEAQQNGHTTIVVGRRGLSKVQEFFMGSVSRKVILLATEQAV